MIRIQVQHSGAVVGPGLSQFFFDGNSQETADDAAVAVATLWVALEAAMLNYAGWEMLPEAAVVNQANGQITGIYTVTGASGLGNVSSEPLPPANQGLVQLRTGVFANGREIRGRVFIPGAPESFNDNGGTNSGYRTILNGAFANLIADANSEYGVWSRTNGTLETVTTAAAWSQWAVLRSRRD